MSDQTSEQSRALWLPAGTELPVRSDNSAPLMEAWGDIIDPREMFDLGEPEFELTRGRMARSHSRVDDRADGKYLPFYETEHDLNSMRARARNLATFTDLTWGAMESLANYTLGTGFQYTAQAANGATNVPAEIIARLQAVIDEFLDRNDFVSDVEPDAHDRSREDGDTLLKLEHVGGGRCDVSLVYGENLTEPAAPRQIEEWLVATGQWDGSHVSCWKFGVHTPKNRTHRHLGYHVVYDGSGNDWEYIPASRAELLKRNVPRSAKRGISDYYPVDADISGEAKLRTNTRTGAAIQAAIAWIREHAAGATEDGISEFVRASSTSQYNKPVKGGSRSTNVEHMRPGTVKDIPAGMKYHAGPMGSLNSPIFIDVAQMVRRSIGVRWNMPEYMISGDASNANFASTLVAESPFVKARERDQRFYKVKFSSLLWKVVRIAWEHGLFDRWGISFRRLQALCEIHVDAPEVASRDKQQQALTSEVYHRMGIVSPRTIAHEAGYDYDEEQQNKQEDGPAMPASPLQNALESVQNGDISGAVTRLREAWEAYP
ncbi:MAG: hypothetical protein ACF8CY_02140 [Gimesia chilikensis]